MLDLLKGVATVPPRATRLVLAIALGIAAAAALGANGAVTVANAARVRETQRRVVHSHLVIETSQQLLLALQSAELAQRAHLLAGEARELDGYAQAVGAARAHLDRLAELTADNPDQRARIAEIRPVVEEELTKLARVAAAGRGKGADRAAFLAAEKLMTLRRLHDQLGRLVTTEEALLGERVRRSVDASRMMVSATLVGLAASLVLLAAAALAVRARLRERARAAAERARAEAELARQAQLLRENDQRKDEFLAMLSHELRNPLTPIRNSVHLLERTDGLPDPARRALSVVSRQSAHLVRLVDDLLDLTRISRGKFRLERHRLDLAELVRRVVEDHRSVLSRHVLKVDLDAGPLPLDGDATRLAQAVGNLLGNAVKFTPEGGEIAVVLRREKVRALVEVIDSGVGIEEPMLERLFEPFAQSERSLARNRGGLGLGLALVKNIVLRHGGAVRAMSEGAGKGTRFRLELPLAEGATDVPPRAATPPPTAPGRRVLLIEDNPDAAETLAELLTLDGHEVHIAHDGPEGLALARRVAPDLVLCDIGLPGMSGYEVARAARQDPDLRDVPMVALSGYASSDDVQRAVQAGFDGHLPKPPRREQLDALLAGPPRAARPPVGRGDGDAGAVLA